ncbi:MAG: ATP-binding protein [Myxococcota bacterium]|nr:ATP-binding protein [Myxococcota bacterium]
MEERAESSTQRLWQTLSLNRPAGAKPLVKRIETLMLARVFMISAIVFGLILIEWTQLPAFSPAQRRELFFLMLAAYSLNLASLFPLRLFPHRARLQGYLQLTLDICLCAVMIYGSRGIEGPFLFLYSLCLFAGAHLYQRSGAWFSAILAIGALILQCIYDASLIELSRPNAWLQLRSVFITGLMNVGALCCIATLTSHLSGQLTKIDQRLLFARRDLAELQGLTREVLTGMENGLIVFSARGETLLSNPAATSLLELSPKSLQSPVLMTLLSKEQWARFERGEKLEPWERDRVLSTGQRQTLHFSLSALPDLGGMEERWLLLIQDLSELRFIELEMRRSERLAAIGGVAAGLAHEIRNPLAGISSGVQLLKRKEVGEDPQRLQLYEIIDRELKRLSELTQEFLDFARPRPPTRTMTDLGDVFRALQPLSPIPLTLEAPDALKLMIDPDQFKQLAWNLIQNAVEAGSDKLEVRIEGCTADEGKTTERALVSFRDWGSGIPVELQRQIFEPFFTQCARGTGLGLALAQQISHAHSGELSVESPPAEGGGGSRFVLSLPLRLPPSAREEAH